MSLDSAQPQVGSALPVFVCFVGIDGAGKTTVAQSFIAYARGQGIAYQYAWGNSQPILMRPIRGLLRRTALRGKQMFQDYEGYRDAKTRLARRNIVLRSLYYSVFLLDYAIWIGLKVALPRILGRRIVCDRYIYDVAINLLLLFDWPAKRSHRLIRWFTRIFPAPQCVFLIDVPESVALSRKTDVPALSYLTERRRIYLSMMQPYIAAQLDGARPIAELTSEAWSVASAARPAHAS